MPSESPGVTAVILAAGAEPGPAAAHRGAARSRCSTSRARRILERQIEVAQRVRREGRRGRARLQEGGDHAPERPLLRQRRVRDDERGRLALPRRQGARGPFLFLYGDILFERGHLEKLLKSPADISILVDRAFGEDQPPPRGAAARPISWRSRTRRRRATASSAPRRRTRSPASAATSPPSEAQGEFVGMAHVHGEGRARAHRRLPPARRDAARRAASTRPTRSAARPSPICSRSSIDRGARRAGDRRLQGLARDRHVRGLPARLGAHQGVSSMSHGSNGPSYAPEFVAALKDAGFDFFAGVPCSLLKGAGLAAR